MLTRMETVREFARSSVVAHARLATPSPRNRARARVPLLGRLELEAGEQA
jgi:hypothetical protein